MVSEQAFHERRGIANLTRVPEQETAGREALIRFLDRWSGTGEESAVVGSLCARFGLYPYMRGTLVDPAEALAVEFHTPAPLAEEGFTLHAGQLAIYHRLMDGESVVLSAPTSFGKSALLDVLVASQQWSNIVLIVPTIALIDETRRRLSRFRSTYTVITHPAQEFAEENNIFVMTQERFLEVELPRIDFLSLTNFTN